MLQVVYWPGQVVWLPGLVTSVSALSTVAVFSTSLDCGYLEMFCLDILDILDNIDNIYLGWPPTGCAPAPASPPARSSAECPSWPPPRRLTSGQMV